MKSTRLAIFCLVLLASAVGRADSIKMSFESWNDFRGSKSFVYNPPQDFDEIHCSIAKVDTVDGNYGASLSNNQPTPGSSVTVYAELIDHVYETHAGAKNLKVAEVTVWGTRAGSTDPVDFLTFDVLMDVPYYAAGVNTLTGKFIGKLVLFDPQPQWWEEIGTAPSISGYEFLGWTGEAVDLGCCSNPTRFSIFLNFYQYFIINGMTTQCFVYANYGPADYTLTISSTDGGGVWPGEGTFGYSDGRVVEIKALPWYQQVFTGWSGTAVTAHKVADPGSAETTVTMDGDYTLVAHFARECTLSVGSTSGGSVTTPGEGTYTYWSHTDVEIVAVPLANYEFTGWSGTAVTAGRVANPGVSSTTVTIEDDYTLIANFAELPANKRTLTISSSQGGSVTTPGEGVMAYDLDSTVAVKAVAQDNYQFAGWTGTAVTAGKVADPTAISTTVTLDDDYTLVANFQGLPRILELSSTAGGSVIAPGEGTFSYGYGEFVTLEAQADDGYEFVTWSGSIYRSTNPITIEMTSDQHLIANFALLPSALTVSSSQGGRVIMPGEGTFSYETGQTIRAVALAEPGYVFDVWTGTLVDSGAVADPGSASVDCVINIDATLSANFIQASRCLYVDDDSPADPSPNNLLLGDPDEDGSLGHPFDSIQEAIDSAQDGDVVLVLPGVYAEQLSFGGKRVVVSALDVRTAGTLSQTVLRGTGADSVVVFENRESAGSVLTGFTIVGGQSELGGGILCSGADPMIVNCLITGNRADKGAGICCIDSQAVLINCTIADNVGWLQGGGLYCDDNVTIINAILSGNQPDQILTASPELGPSVTYSAVSGGWPGIGNIGDDPGFAGPGYWALLSDPNTAVDADTPDAMWIGGDYHLKSEEGHWNGWAWVSDDSTSCCIDLGRPDMDATFEPQPNGHCVNLGAFGGTAEASKTYVAPPSKKDDFETGDFSLFDWTFSGDAQWQITGDGPHAGQYCAQACPVSDGETSTLSVTADCVEGQMSFFVKVSSETDYDLFTFYIDGVQQDQWSGIQDWRKVSVPVAAGSRTFTWTFAKDSSYSEGQDTAWIDDVTFPVE